MNLRHPNIVQLYDFSETRNNYYFIMEYCSKGTLEHMMIENGGCFSERDVMFIFRQMVEGCMYLFKESVFHRDLKPANVLINHLNQVKIADFGFCKKLEE
jgi:serine/threonine protein kinase